MNDNLTSPIDELEGDDLMPEITCDSCGHSRVMEIEQADNKGYSWRPGDIVRGTFICSQCGTSSPFEVTEKALTFKLGSRILPELEMDAPEVRSFYDEARLCISFGAPRAAVAMARSMLEEALRLAGCTGKLDAMIRFAAQKKIITQAEVTIAHGARIIGNDGLHESDAPVTQAEALTTFSACVSILNRMSTP